MRFGPFLPQNSVILWTSSLQMAEQNARYQEEQASAQQLQATLNEAHRIEVESVRDQVFF
jgi:hypothetical protein